MILNKFPYTYKQELDNETNEKAKQINSERSNDLQHLNSSSSTSIGNLYSSKNTATPAYGPFAGGGFVVGLIIGAFVCFTNGDAIDAKINFSDSIGSAIMFWLMFGAVGAVLALILCGIGSTIQNSSNNNIDGKIAATKKRTEDNIIATNARYDEMIQKMVTENNALYQNYLTSFNAEAQKQSVRFTESPLAVEVIEWMTGGYSRTIDSVDRRSHIEQINVPFVFRTYRNKIECNLGTFDFEIKRCDELATPLEQTALTRAIASAIQLNITMKYPQDVSGTAVVSNINYEYKNDCVMATIVYTAPNGNYKSTRGWAVN